MTRALHTLDCDVAPNFTAVYLRVERGECAFIETHTGHARPRLLQALDTHGLRPEDVRYIVVTHAHLDHAAGAGGLLARCPNATLLAHPRAAAHLIAPEKLVSSAKRVYGEARFATLYGEVEAAPPDRVRVLEDHATFELGGAAFRVRHTAGHARHHLVVHDVEHGAVFTGDALGLVYPALQSRGRFALASTSPIDFEPDEARRALDTILGLGAATACLTHFGAFTDLEVIAGQVRQWIDLSEALLLRCMDDASPVEAQVAQVEAALRAALRPYGFSESELRLLATDLDLNAQGIVVAAQRRRR